MDPEIRYERRASVDPHELDALFLAAWGAGRPGYERVFAHSFTWITARSAGRLVGFVNVAWDGDVHYFLLDTTVDPEEQGQGIARRLVEEAIDACRGHGEWLHVDADAELMKGLYERCGFEPTPAGILDLSRSVAPQDP